MMSVGPSPHAGNHQNSDFTKSNIKIARSGGNQWAKNNNSLLIVTFDENDDVDQYHGLTDPRVTPNPSDSNNYRRQLDLQNRIVTIFAGARIRPGHKPDAYPEGKGITHVNILRTIEAMYVWLA